MKNIYVGNLDYNVSEQDLRAAFEPYGQVDNVTIMRDRDTGQPRGFAFVEMANDEEAQKAIAGTNGTQLGKRNINVNEARPKTERPEASVAADGPVVAIAVALVAAGLETGASCGF